MSEAKMVVGLGNPGDKYAETRHNVGFRVIESLAEALQLKVKKRKFGAVFGTGKHADKKLILLKPWEYMNCSGRAVAKAAAYYKLDPDDLLVITDDMALPLGRIRIRAKGSSGGHKGLADVMEKLGTESIGRLRVGIGQSGEEDAVDFVLDRPAQTEVTLLSEAIGNAKEATLCWLEHGIEAAMNKFNSRQIAEENGETLCAK
ncbi:MAG: aminoacyl-tRNA hydrolase [Planctomycetota bacterium]|jgi:PTH1 family peptidyl-tRNA hydrolase